MPTRNYKPEQIVTILRQIEVQMANGKTSNLSRDVRCHHRCAKAWPALRPFMVRRV